MIVLAALIVGAGFVAAVLCLLDSISRTETLIRHRRELAAKGYSPSEIDDSANELQRAMRWWE